MRKIKEKLITLLFVGLCISTMTVKGQFVDVTSAYLFNANFNSDIQNTATQGNNYFGDDGTFLNVAGWDRDKYGWGVAATYAYGHENTLHGKIVPATDTEGNADGAVLGIVNAWGGWVKYSQNVTLPAGIYEIHYLAYNANEGTNTINYIGFVANQGNEILSSKNTFPSNQWTKDSVTFVLTEEVEGKIQLGLGSANSGSGDKAGLFFDYVKILSDVDDLTIYKSTLSTFLEQAQETVDAGGFYSQLGATVESAIQKGNEAKASTSLDETLVAMGELRSSLLALKMGLADYIKLSDYIDEIGVAINVYNRTDLSEYYDTLQSAYDNQLWDAARIDEELARKESLLFSIELAPAVAVDYKIKQQIDVELVESSFTVKYTQFIAGDHHFIAYYDKDKNMCVGYRTLSETSFKKTVLNSKIAWDSHNNIEMIVDNEGYIHVSGNMHNVQLLYWRSNNPYDGSAFTEVHSMTGSEEDNVTYPKFLMTNSGDLLFHYRYGVSGNGYEVYNIWDPQTKTWSRFLDEPLIDGQGLRNAYMQGPYYEADGYYHLHWVWRETPNAATNHDFSYARSKDLKNWESAAGEAVASPITFSETKLRVDVSSKMEGTGTLNNVPKYTLDSENRVVLVNMKYDERGNSQLYAYRLKADKTWEEKVITNWVYRFQFGGYGSLIAEIDVDEMRNLGNGELGVKYTHSKYGEGEIILDEATLEPIAIRTYAKSYPKELDELTITGTYSKPMAVHINQTGNYILRWEAMGANNDQKPTGTLPPNIMLQMIELKADSTTSNAKTYHKSNLNVQQLDSNIQITGLNAGEKVTIMDLKCAVMQRFVANGSIYYIPTPK